MERSSREAQVLTLYTEGWTQSAIADKLGISTWAVTRDLVNLEQFGVLRKRFRQPRGAHLAGRNVDRDPIIEPRQLARKRPAKSESPSGDRETNRKESIAMSVSDGQIDVSAGAQSAIKNAMSSLQAYASEPRVAALISKLATIANPEGDTGDDGQLAKSMADAEAIAKSEGVSAQLRERAGAARLELERAYLAKHSASGSAAWEEAARAAGHAA